MKKPAHTRPHVLPFMAAVERVAREAEGAGQEFLHTAGAALKLVYELKDELTHDLFAAQAIMQKVSPEMAAHLKDFIQLIRSTRSRPQTDHDKAIRTGLMAIDRAARNLPPHGARVNPTGERRVFDVRKIKTRGAQ